MKQDRTTAAFSSERCSQTASTWSAVEEASPYVVLAQRRDHRPGGEHALTDREPAGPAQNRELTVHRGRCRLLPSPEVGVAVDVGAVHRSSRAPCEEAQEMTMRQV